MRDLDLKTLRLLVAVCDLQNIKAAARQENIEPSAISKRIAQLEDALGTPLLVRSRRGVRPTPAGIALLEHARTLLFTVERLERDVSAFGEGVRGHVHLTASASAIAESLLDDVAAFLRLPESRHVKVDIDERTSRELVRAVRDGVASLGVCWDNVDFEGLGHQPYRTDQLAVLVHRDHPLARQASLRFEQTLDHDHVGLPPNTAVQGMLQRAAARCGRSVSWRVVVSNFDAALRVVAANLSISVIPYQVFRSNPKPEVVAIPLTDPWARRRFAICYRDRDTLQPAAARMLEFLGARAEAAADPADASHPSMARLRP